MTWEQFYKPQSLNASDEGDDLFTGEQLRAAVAVAIAAEREACAKVCENIGDYDENVDEYYSDIYASAIRARGEKK
jgi:hypothetical protein